MKRNVWGTAIFVLAAGFAGSAAAEISTFTQSNVTSPGNFGTLTSGLNASGQAILTLAPSAGNTFFDTNALDLNLASGISILSVAPGAGSTAGAITFVTGSFQNDGFGTFNNQINIFDGPTNGIAAGETLVVTLSGTTSTSLTTIFANNGSGFDASGHVLNDALGSNCTMKVGENFPGATNTITPSTGNCEVSPPPPNVPEPGSLLILGSAMLMLGSLTAVGRRRRR